MILLIVQFIFAIWLISDINLEPDFNLQTSPILEEFTDFTPTWIDPIPPQLLMINPCWNEAEQRHIHATIINWRCVVCDMEVEPQYCFIDSDFYILTQLLCGEAGVFGDGEYDFEYDLLNKEVNYYEISKVLSVIMNRTKSSIFPDTVREVILDPNQFVVMPKNLYSTPSDSAVEVVKTWCEAYARYDLGVSSIPETFLYFSEGPNITNIIKETW